MPKNCPPDCECWARSFVAISKARDVNALLIEMSMLPIQAPSMRTWETRLPAFVDHGDVHRLFDFERLLFGGCNDLSCFFERHCHASFTAIPCNRSATTISHRSSRELSQVSPHWHADRPCRCTRSSAFMQFSFFRITLKALSVML